MIAQTIAARHPGAVRSLTSIMSNTGARLTGQPSLRVYPTLLRPPSKTREEFIERMVAVFALIGSPGIMRDVEEVRELAAQSYERDHDPAGPGRQLGAIVASGNRTEELRRILGDVADANDQVAEASGRSLTRLSAETERLHEELRHLGRPPGEPEPPP